MKPNARRMLIGVLLAATSGLVRAQPPAYPLQYAAFAARFHPDGTFALEGSGWPAFKGTWKAANGEVEIMTPDAPGGCDKPGRYRFRTQDARTTLDAVIDDCRPRRMILDRS